MLMLVYPAREGQATDPPAGRRKGHKAGALSLTAEENRHTRAALKKAAWAYGGHDVLALVMGVPVDTLYKAGNPRRILSGTFAIRLARAAGVAVEALLSGTFTAAGRCPTCGHRAGDGRVAAAGVHDGPRRLAPRAR
jgi:hypothetical protein